MTNLPFSAGPFSRVGMTIVGARVPRLDDAGAPIPGQYTQPALAELLVPRSSAAELEGNFALFLAAPELLAERNELALHLRNAIDYIEHGEANRRHLTDLAQLRGMLDREMRTQGPMQLALASGNGKASFDIAAARTALAHVGRDADSQMPTYSQLVELAGRLAEQLSERHHPLAPRDSSATHEQELLQNAFEVLSRTRFSPTPACAEPDNDHGRSPLP